MKKTFILILATAALIAVFVTGCDTTQHEGLYITENGTYYKDKNGNNLTGYIETERGLLYFGADGKLVEDASIPQKDKDDSAQQPSASAASIPGEPVNTDTPAVTDTPSTEPDDVFPSKLTDSVEYCSDDLLEEVDSVLKKYSNDSAEDKLKATFDWMRKKLKYKYITVDLSEGYTEPLIADIAETVALTLKGSCEHQAALMCIFARRIGYPAMIVSGDFLSDDGSEWVEHAWVIVQDGNSFRHIDVLFGRNHTGGKPYTMFMQTDDTFSRHRWNTEEYPACE